MAPIDEPIAEAADVRAASTTTTTATSTATSTSSVGAATVAPTEPVTGGLGDSPLRPDGALKVQGRFAFSSDDRVDAMLHGATLRSPHAAARIVRIDIAPALAITGVRAVLTASDVPGTLTYGLIDDDQPVLADGVVRYQGEPVALVAADHPETARRALGSIVVEWEPLPVVADPEDVIAGTARELHPRGNVFRRQDVACGDQELVGEVRVEGTYEIGMQDQAFLGLEAALGIPDPDGAGVELFVATQWLHEDRKQLSACLGLAPERVRLTLSGVGGAFGGREDLSLQVHTALLALHTRRPVRMQYTREESFFGHVHRHPATIWMRHHADRDGTLRRVEARMVFDGGAYASTSHAVLFNAITHAQGPYRCLNATVEGWAVRTNNPPCGAMRGFGVVQACFAHESQMDRLAEACGLDPVEVRLRNAMVTGDRLITGQVVDSVAPVERCIRETVALPMPPDGPGGDAADPRLLPGGVGLTTDAAHVRRGVGFGVSIKNLMYSEGFDDYSTARCRLADGVATLKFATAEVGQGFVTLAQQIARTRLGVSDVVLEPIDTSIDSSGSTSASRQTWMSGGAVDAACRAVRSRLLDAVAQRHSIEVEALEIVGTDVVSADGSLRVPVTEASAGLVIDESAHYRHRPTVEPDAQGQGDSHVAFAFVAHRAVVDVDPELGLVRVVQIATAQDVGVALNPLSVRGQIEGGIAQGLGLAVMEEIVVRDGIIRNPSFTDYLLPTALDAPEVVVSLVEEYEPLAPLGAKGVGEPPCISVTPAIVAAIRNATGRRIDRTPVRPQDICG
ncbi:MAG: xanthine dehydrogenase subunit D [Microthrixaceae bacterium]